jgi:hypothetical protein
MPDLLSLDVHANAIGDEAIAALHASLKKFCLLIEDIGQFSMEPSQDRWPFHKAQP